MASASLPASVPSTVLVHFSGPDKTGLTAALTGVLVEHNVGILDIGRSVVHENVSIGLLLEIPAGCDIGKLRHVLHHRAHELGLLARFTPVLGDALQHWVHGLHHQHFIVTVLGRSITAEQLARISALIAGHGMNIERIERLSGQLSPCEPSANACIEFLSISESAPEATMLRSFL